jgi:5-formyltetrahydrofolate cyclo-ligase
VLFGPRKGARRIAWDEETKFISTINGEVENSVSNEIGSVQNIDLLVVPGVAFDANCNRVGHGKGYYDSFIHRNQTRQASDTRQSGKSTFLIGVALNEQLIEEVPHDDRDMRLDAIVCESRGIIKEVRST